MDMKIFNKVLSSIVLLSIISMGLAAIIMKAGIFKAIMGLGLAFFVSTAITLAIFNLFD